MRLAFTLADGTAALATCSAETDAAADAIRARFGERGLTGYAPAYGRSGGAITDDTQMTLFTADGLIRAVNR